MPMSDEAVAYIYEVWLLADETWHERTSLHHPDDAFSDSDSVEYRNVRALAPKDSLSELVAEWREEYGGQSPGEIVNGGHQMRARGLYKCADELEAVLEDE